MLLILRVLLFETEHIGHSYVVRTQQWTSTSVQSVKRIHIVGTNVAISIMVKQVETELELLFVSLGHHCWAYTTQICREIDATKIYKIQAWEDLINNYLAIFLKNRVKMSQHKESLFSEIDLLSSRMLKYSQMKHSIYSVSDFYWDEKYFWTILWWIHQYSQKRRFFSFWYAQLRLAASQEFVDFHVCDRGKT